MNKIFLFGPQPPLYSYGGPVRSIESLDRVLKNSFDVLCISPSKNLNGDKVFIKPLNGKLFSSKPFTSLIFNCLKSRRSIVWFNSFFEVKIFLLLLLSSLSFFKIIISSRGQLANGAINSSNARLKHLFIKIFRFFFAEKIYFHATDLNEHNDIKSFFPKAQVNIIPNISSQKYKSNNNTSHRFVFFSRITKKKGLLELLECIDGNYKSLQLDIYGFKEDLKYWSRCEELIKKNPNINYCGELPDGKLETLANKHTFFILPTYNENYGHVIFEALSLGLIPILTKGTNPFDKEIQKIVNLNFDLDSSMSNSISKALSMNINEISGCRKKLKFYFEDLIAEQNKFEQQYVTFINKIINTNA
ncbi:glycosyltransferase [Flavobacteriaceae bacterium]|nr:glycosyltransferase [Flavobacteriaceae bacterium]